MLKRTYITLGLFLSLGLIAQEKVKYFTLEYNGSKVANSSFGSLKFIDSREDTSCFGSVHLGMLDKEAKVRPEGSFETQLGVLLTKLNGEKVDNNQMIFQLRRLKFVEKADAGMQYGYCFFRANIFTPSNGDFKLVSSIDTFIVVESKKEVTKQIIQNANNSIITFFKNALGKDVNKGISLTYEDIVKIDSIEKSKIKVYTTTEYVNGIYRSFESFKEQTPEYSLFSITFEDGEITEIKAKNDQGRLRKISSDEVYAIVNNGKPYISAEFGYYPLVKNNNDFYFIGDDKVNYIKGQVVKQYVYTPLPITSQFEIKIDHMNGRFMRVKEIK